MSTNTLLPAINTSRDVYYAGEAAYAPGLDFEETYKAWRKTIRPGAITETELRNSFWRGWMRTLPKACRGSVMPLPKY